MKRWAVLVAVVFSLAAFSLIAPASSAQQPQELGHHVRFDLVQVVQGTVLAGGTDVGKDAMSGDTIRMTGTGEFKPATADAAGGGTFIHRRMNNTEVAHGVWLVIGFVSWTPAHGFFPPALVDGIGETSEASAGIATVHVKLFPSGATTTPVGTLSVFCNLPGAAFPIEEGISLTLDGSNFEQAGGVTVFHIVR
jgi:hypothetical protein